MYKYLNINLLDDDLKLKSKEISITTDLDFITDYIYNYSYLIIKHKFDLYNSKYQDSIYLNPYARTILILKVAKEYLHKININKIIHLKNNSFKPIQIKHNLISNQYLNKCIELIKFLYLFNGEVKFNPIHYKKVDINDLDYNHMYIKKFAEQYLDSNILKDLNSRCKIPNNMYYIKDDDNNDNESENDDEIQHEEIKHPHFDIFIKTIHDFFYYLQIYQMYIQQFEIDNIKKYISKLILIEIERKQKKKINSSQNEIQKYLFDSSQLSLFRKHICISNQEAIFIKSNNLCDNISIYLKDCNNLFEELTDNEINEYKSIKIEDLLNEIHEKYIEVLNINPFDVKFKNIEIQTDPFDFIYLYQKYENLYSSL